MSAGGDRLGIAGYRGRMGQSLIACAARQGWPLAAVTALETDLPLPEGVVQVADPAGLAKAADVWIDFTLPEASHGLLEGFVRGPRPRAYVLGTTGLSAASERLLEQAARQMPIVRSGNFSIGVAALEKLVADTAARLGPEWDIEITETHHRAKVDAPSGTALMLGRAAARGRGTSLESLQLPIDRNASRGRERGGIGFSVVRGGGVIGLHEVHFLSGEERITLTHQAYDRTLFAQGALQAARWALMQAPGLYSLADVLG